MERGDLLNENGKIFVGQGRALNKFASRNVKVVVVGNPANTNCLIAAANAPDLGPEQFSALTRLDHDRALAQIAQKLKIHTTDIDRLCIWGNHSATQYPDLSHAIVNGQLVRKLINDEKWIRDFFIPTVQKRGAAILEARGASSAASAANAALVHMRDWVAGTNGKWTSMAIPSDSTYG
jgi:malate dehydrogenase